MSSNNEILDTYLFENNSLLEQLESIVLDAEGSSAFSEDNINEIFRIMHTIKGSSAMMEFDSLASVAHRIEEEPPRSVRDHVPVHRLLPQGNGKDRSWSTT